MPIQRMIKNGSFIPDPETYPTDLVTVIDVYGHRHRVRQKHLDAGRAWLPRFNQYSVQLLSNRTPLNRDNIAKETP